MRANTQRSDALAFGELVSHYDAGRIRYGPDFIAAALDRLGLGLGGRQLEVGAGTGQLTASLLAMNAQVTAVEPAPAMAGRLRRTLADEIQTGQLQILQQPFEHLNPADHEAVAQIWSTDAWHWIDPLTGYRLAAELLQPDGHLINTWGFPVLADPNQQARLNEVYRELSPDLVRDPPTHLSSLEPLLDQGRREITDSRCMRVVDYWTEPMQVHVTTAKYIQWQLSYAHIAKLTEPQQTRLGVAIGNVLTRPSESSVDVTVWRYTVAAMAQPRR